MIIAFMYTTSVVKKKKNEARKKQQQQQFRLGWDSNPWPPPWYTVLPLSPHAQPSSCHRPNIFLAILEFWLICHGTCDVIIVVLVLWQSWKKSALSMQTETENRKLWLVEKLVSLTWYLTWYSVIDIILRELF